jgi:hypothetical protein
MPANSVSNFSVADYNDLFAGAGASGLVRMDTSIFTILADWQTASSLDANSVSGNPQFTSDSDLHVSNAVVNANAVTIAGITTDIDGQTRNVTTPDIGADEFTPLANNIGLVSILAPVNGTCGDSATALIVVITNYGTGAQTGFTVDADITGTITQSLTETYSSSLTSNETDTIIFSQTLNTFAGDSIGVVVYTSLGSDQNRSNDTLTASFTLFGHPNPPTAVSPQPACDNNLQITATPDSGDALAWYDAASGGNLLYTGSVFSPTGVTTDTTFYVEARQGSGNVGCLRITEIMPDDNPISDYIEVQNVSGGIVNATGWVVVAGDNSGDINVFNDTLWQLGTFNPGEVQYRQDLSGDPNFWGQNIAWTGGTAGWAMILDNFGNVVDFVAWEFTAAEISAMNTVINGFNVTIGSEWSGDGYVSCSGNSNVRIGSSDNNDATDWSCEPPSEGTQNAGIASIFTNCGVGACGSARIPVDVTLVPGITVDLGNDTMIGNPFSIILDADTGYTSYLWSTGDTTQTITVTAYDTYWVTVTGGPNNCSATDSIVVSLNVGVTPTISRDEFSFYPNPAKDKLVIKGNEQFLQNAVFRITDISGKVALDASYIKSSGNSTIDISKLTNGVYFLQVIAGDRTGVQKFVVLK